MRFLKFFVLIIGALFIELLCVGAVASLCRDPGYMMDGLWHRDPILQAFNFAAMAVALLWVGIGIWQLYKRVPFPFLAWGIAVLFSGTIFYLAIHG